MTTSISKSDFIQTSLKQHQSIYTSFKRKRVETKEDAYRIKRKVFVQLEHSLIPSSLENLPSDTFLHILSYLNPINDLLRISRLNRWIHNKSFDADLWMRGLALSQSLVDTIIRCKLTQTALVSILRRIAAVNPDGLRGLGVIRLCATSPSSISSMIPFQTTAPVIAWHSVLLMLSVNVREIRLDGINHFSVMPYIHPLVAQPFLPVNCLPLQHRITYPSTTSLRFRRSTALNDCAFLSLACLTPNLTYLDLIGCPQISDNLLTLLSLHCPLLSRISIGGDVDEEEVSSVVTDKGISFLSRNAMYLTHLTLVHMDGITPNIRNILSLQAPQLEYLSIKTCQLHSMHESLSNCEQSTLKPSSAKRSDVMTLEIEYGVCELHVFLSFLTAFPHCTTAYLHPSYCPLDEEQVSLSLHASFGENINTLLLHSDVFSHNSSRLSFFDHIPHLQHFTIGTESTDAGDEVDATDLVHSMTQRCHDLLSFASINTNVHPSIIDALALGCPQLETLQISESPCFVNLPLSTNKTVLKNLSSVDIWSGTALTDADVMTLIQKMPNVRHLSFLIDQHDEEMSTEDIAIALESNSDASLISSFGNSAYPSPRQIMTITPPATVIQNSLISVLSMTAALINCESLQSIKIYGPTALTQSQLNIISDWNVNKKKLSRSVEDVFFPFCSFNINDFSTNEEYMLKCNLLFDSMVSACKP